MSATTGQAIAMIIYFVAMIIIGIYGYTRTNNIDDYMLGGRQLNPLVAALSAGAADMSGWLLMGLPGAIYANGLIDGWIAVGLTVGAWVNWKIVAPRLRTYTQVSSNSITVPSFLGSRLKDDKNIIRIVSGVIILVFFTLYVSSGMVAGGVFFESSFGMNYYLGMTLVAGVVILYTLVGGFLAVSYTDTVQGLMMLAALILVPIIGFSQAGGIGATFATVREVSPALLNPFGDPKDFGVMTIITIVSALAWGLGYFGQPHIVIRFMALRTPKEATSARRIAIGWMVLSVLGASLTAFVGVAIYKHNKEQLANPESVFIALGQLMFHPVIAGFMLAAILAAIMSTISSQLIVTSSALVEDIYRAYTKRDLSGNAGVNLGRIAVLGVSVFAALLAAMRNDSILGLVAFAWAGFGGAFGPIIILSLYWRKLTRQGAIAGMIVGAVTVFAWKYLVAPFFPLYEILPAFLLNLLVAWLVSKATYKPDPRIEKEFNESVELLAENEPATAA